MRIFPIKFSAWISLLAVLMQACALPGYRHSQTAPAGSGVRTSVFSPEYNRGLYKTTISVMGHDFSGLILMKKVDRGHFRISFFNELGMTFLDGDLQVDSKGIPGLEIHKIYGPLNRKGLISALQESFRLLPWADSGKPSSSIIKNKKNEKYLLEYGNMQGHKYYLEFGKGKNPASTLSVSKCMREKAVAGFNYTPKYENGPSGINILIKGPGLKINMERIE